MGLSAREVRIVEATPFTKRFAARWVYAHGVIQSRADDVESDCLYAMVVLATEWDATRNVPWMKYLGTRLKHRLIDELRLAYGRTPSEQRQAITHPDQLHDHHATLEPGYVEVERQDQLDRLLAPHALRTRQIVKARLAGWSMAEIGDAHDISACRVSQLITGVKDPLTVVRAFVAVARRE